MKGSEKKKRIGIASMLERAEIKEYFDTLVVLIGGLEFVIFIAHFVGSLGPDKGPFPWKQYFFISFIAPVVLIFIIGLVVMGFNYYVYGSQNPAFNLEDNPLVGSKIKRFGHSFKFLFTIIQQLPVLVGLFFLGVGSVVLYKLDVILRVMGHIGEKTAFYLFIVLCVILGCGLIFLLFWLYCQFKLHKYNLQQQWEYKKKVIERSGLIILENNTVCNQEGKIIAYDGMAENNDNQTEERLLLPGKKMFSK